MDVSRGERFLDEALSSLAVQTFRDFEIVLCAHGSDYATGAIVSRWEQLEPRLRVFRSARLSLSQAHMEGANRARGALLARLDADDVARPDRLMRQVEMFAAKPDLGFAGSTVDVIDERGRVLSQLRNPLSHQAIVSALPNSCPLVHSTLMVRAELFRQAGGYRDGLNISEDYDLYCRLIEHGRAANSAAALVAYRIHLANMSSRYSMRMAIANETVRAARLARSLGRPEPFVQGSPSLHRAGAVLGLPRQTVRRRVVAMAAQSKASRDLLAGRLSLRINGWLRTTALLLGLRPAYSALFIARAWLLDWLRR